jgi:hypothetical protein
MNRHHRPPTTHKDIRESGATIQTQGPPKHDNIEEGKTIGDHPGTFHIYFQCREINVFEMDKLFSLFTSMTATRLFYERGPHETK